MLICEGVHCPSPKSDENIWSEKNKEYGPDFNCSKHPNPVEKDREKERDMTKRYKFENGHFCKVGKRQTHILNITLETCYLPINY